jgi:hypothetical protein
MRNLLQNGISFKPTPGMRKRFGIILLIILILIVAIRIAMPYVILRYANKTLATMPGYRGHIKDIDLAVLRGAYHVDSIYLNKYDSASGRQTPFFGAKEVDLSIEWQSLFKGSLVGELDVLSPSVRFTKDKVEPKHIKKDSSTFKKMLDDFMPLKVNRFEIKEGKIQYIDESSKPRVDIQLTNAHIVATNLRNAYDSSDVLPAEIKAKAEVYDGTLDFFMKLNPLADNPTFDMNAELKNTNLVKLNDFFQAYAKVDVNKGTFGLYTEVAGKNGFFTGYVKPVMKDVSLLGKEDRKDNVFRKLWEGLVGVVGQAFENLPKDQVATKIPFKGEIKDPKANVWYAIANILENAFIQAIQPSIDNEISIAEVKNPKKEKKTFVEKIFGRKEKDRDKKSRKSVKERDKKSDKERDKKS